MFEIDRGVARGDFEVGHILLVCTTCMGALTLLAWLGCARLVPARLVAVVVKNKVAR